MTTLTPASTNPNTTFPTDTSTADNSSKKLKLLKESKLLKSEYMQLVTDFLQNQSLTYLENHDWELYDFGDRIKSALRNTNFSPSIRESLDIAMDIYLSMHLRIKTNNHKYSFLSIQYSFQNTSQCWKTEGDCHRFPNEIHIKALTLAQFILSSESTSSDQKQSMINALPCIINHEDFTVDQQIDGYLLGLSHISSINNQVNFAFEFCRLEYISPHLREEASKTLFNYARLRSTDNYHRMSIINCLPFLPVHTGISKTLREQSCKVLTDIITSRLESEKIKVESAKELSYWVWSVKSETELTELQIDVITFLLKQLANSKQSEEVSKNICKSLFYRVTNGEDSEPELQYLSKKLVELYESKEISDKIRVLVAKKFPKSTNYITPTSQVCMDLFQYMVRELENKETNERIKIIFIKHIASYYRKKESKEKLIKIDKKYCDINFILKIPSISESENLKKIANKKIQKYEDGFHHNLDEIYLLRTAYKILGNYDIMHS